MQLDRLLIDVTGCAESDSQRSKEMALGAALRARYGDDAITDGAVSKWFERGSMPARWLMKTAALPETPLNLNAYA
jgi:hypothetical protein